MRLAQFPGSKRRFIISLTRDLVLEVKEWVIGQKSGQAEIKSIL